MMEPGRRLHLWVRSTCANPLSCTLTRTGTMGDTGDHVAGETKVTAIANYRFSGNRTIVKMNPMEDLTWLAFGVWLTKTAGADDAAANAPTYAFGAFAAGGSTDSNWLGCRSHRRRHVQG